MAIQANQALIEGAFKKGAAKASADVVDMKPVFERDKAIGKYITDTMVGVMGAIKQGKMRKKMQKEKGLEPFKAIANEAYETLYSQGEPLGNKYIDAVTKAVEELQDEFEAVNTAGKGDTRENERKRMEIQGRLKRITNQAINCRATFMEIGQSADNWNTDRIHDDNIVPLQTALDIKNADKNKNLRVEFIDDELNIIIDNVERTHKVSGHVEKARPGATYVEGYTDTGTTDETWDETYTESVSFNLPQMKAALPTKNLETDKEWMASINENLELGASDAKSKKVNKWTNPRNIERAEHAFASKIKTKDQFNDNSREIDGLGRGFKDDMWNNIDIPVSALQVMFGNDTSFLDSIDIVGDDGVINDLDYEALSANPDWEIMKQNIEQLHDALTNTDNPAFSLETSVPLLAKYKVNQDVQAYNDSYNASTKNKFKVGSEYVLDGTTYVYQQDGTFLIK